jgi:hypothetical protein
MKICPYFKEPSCGVMLFRDALALIQRLDETVVKTEMVAHEIYGQKDELESKLNQAVEDIRMLGRTGEFICPVCAHYNHGEGKTGKCVKCLTGDGFEWRGSRERQAAD